mgnify:CR=1 FL=1
MACNCGLFNVTPTSTYTNRSVTLHEKTKDAEKKARKERRKNERKEKERKERKEKRRRDREAKNKPSHR